MTLTLKMSSTTKTSSTISTSFAANHGSDLAVLLSKVSINWPQDTAGPGPRPFKFVIPFPAKPFTYKNTAGLCWEVRIHSNNVKSYHGMDAVNSYYYDTTKKLGSGCKSASQTRNSYMAMYTYFYGGPDRWRIYQYSYYLGKRQPGFWILGDSDKNFAGLSLPLDLTPFGIKGCKLYTSVLETIAKNTSTSGYLYSYIYVPYTPALVGLWIYGQTGSLDPGRPGIPLVFANGYGVKLGAKPVAQPVSRLYSKGSDTATSGYYSKHYGLVTQFTYK